MKEVIPMDNYGLFIDADNTARANSVMVADIFHKRHDNVLASIREILAGEDDDNFNLLNFKEITYKDERGRSQPAYAMTRDGFVLLAMGFNGKRAMRFKKAYIKRFNEMEQFIRTLIEARQDFPRLTESIRMMHENPKNYHFSNECNMLNRIVTGMTAKQFREKHGLEKGQSIRPYLSPEQIELLETLQNVDIGLVISVPDFHQRQRYLEWYASMSGKQLTA